MLNSFKSLKLGNYFVELFLSTNINLFFEFNNIIYIIILVEITC